MTTGEPFGSERKGVGTTRRPWGRGVRWYLEAGEGAAPRIERCLEVEVLSEVSLNSERNPEGIGGSDTVPPNGPVRPEEHVRLAMAMTRRVFRRPTPDDFGIARLALVEAAAQWNAGKRPCRWSTFAGNRIRWELLYRYQLASTDAIAAEVPLFLAAADDEEAEIERPEMAVEDPELRAAYARADVEAFLEGLTAGEALVLRRRFGIGGTEPLTREAVGEELGVGKERVRQIEVKALARLRKRVGRRTFTIPLDSARSERLR